MSTHPAGLEKASSPKLYPPDDKPFLALRSWTLRGLVQQVRESPETLFLTLTSTKKRTGVTWLRSARLPESLWYFPSLLPASPRKPVSPEISSKQVLSTWGLAGVSWQPLTFWRVSAVSGVGVQRVGGGADS